MVRALPGRKTRYRPPLEAISDENRAAEEQRRAALGYLVWPAALIENYLDREPASHWYRHQVRQALRFGLTWTAIGIVALIWPLIVALIIGNVLATLIVYGVAIVLDCAVFVVWLRRALRYSKQAARGETFTVTPPFSPTRRVEAKR